MPKTNMQYWFKLYWGPAMPDLSTLRETIRDDQLAAEEDIIARLTCDANLSLNQRAMISADATELVTGIRADKNPGLMEVFLSEYGLSTDEGIALMCLAEALLRVPDAETIDELIEDKIAPSEWERHLGNSSSSLVNASTWALMLTGRVLDDDRSRGVAHILHGAVKRLGEPIIRVAVRAAMKEMGNQFVLGETITDAVKRGKALEAIGFTYSYDMLGEAALTAADAEHFFNVYSDAIAALAKGATSTDIRENPGISIKLSALHPRYEEGQRDRVMRELVERTLTLTRMARDANMGLNIDAEEADRLDLSLDVIAAVLQDSALVGWDGFGVVVQAYSKRAASVIDWLYALAKTHNRKIMVRLVKGAYWDTEIKRSQVEGLSGFPVFIRKPSTDVSYICCAKKLLEMTDRIYPQFATHNAHTVAAVLKLAQDIDTFEFQRLHGMGEVLHRKVLESKGARCRIYAPVGAHKDLLAYLVRRLLENGANSSFVNQIVDETVPPEQVAADPFLALGETAAYIRNPANLYSPERQNSRGWDVHSLRDIDDINVSRVPFADSTWSVGSNVEAGPEIAIINPANPTDTVGSVREFTLEQVDDAIGAAAVWDDSPEKRTEILNRAADLYEQNYGQIFAVLCREAGKTPADAIAELREAVDFLRYYASRIDGAAQPRGLFACVSPWNFPLAIFTGQIAAALATGNGVLAKPAEATPIVASLAVGFLHQAGVPRNVLQLLPGQGAVVGTRLVSDARIDGVCFTGSTATAQSINRAIAKNMSPDVPLIAETGGINAMIVDSTALPEQAVEDIVTSAFRSAGQRCSALRLLYLQEDIAALFLKMLSGAMDELVIGDPWNFATDVGPIIDDRARRGIVDHIAMAKTENRLIKQLNAPERGCFVGPALIRVSGISHLQQEIFGPVLHVATFKSSEIDQIVSDINASGYGLTFGLHTRISDRVEQISSKLKAGNIYINRNQIGAIVGSQPFGGEGLSGTGPKAGGPRYMERFTKQPLSDVAETEQGHPVTMANMQLAVDALPQFSEQALNIEILPGPTGESNRLSVHARGVVLCLGPTQTNAMEQARIARQQGCTALVICSGATCEGEIDGFVPREALTGLRGIHAVALWSDPKDQRTARIALAAREGALIPLITGSDMAARCVVERHECIDTTASGGNTSLLAGV